MNNLIKIAIVDLLLSIGAMVWGFNYRSDHPMAAVGAFFGHADPTYSLEGWASGLGVLGFVIGIALLIGGLVRSSR